MQYPHPVTIIAPAGADEYGNPDQDFSAPTTVETVGFMFEKAYQTGPAYAVLLPPDTVIAPGYRLSSRGETYRVAFVTKVESPSKTIMLNVSLQELP